MKLTRYKSIFRENYNYTTFAKLDPEKAEMIKGSFHRYLHREPKQKELDKFYKSNENKFWKKDGRAIKLDMYDIDQIVRLYLKAKPVKNISDKGGYILD